MMFVKVILEFHTSRHFPWTFPLPFRGPRFAGAHLLSAPCGSNAAQRSRNPGRATQGPLRQKLRIFLTILCFFVPKHFRGGDGKTPNIEIFDDFRTSQVFFSVSKRWIFLPPYPHAEPWAAVSARLAAEVRARVAEGCPSKGHLPHR